MTDGLGQTRLYEMNQRRGATRGHVLDAPRVTGGQESSAPRVGRAQEGQDAETTAMRTRTDGECSDFIPVENDQPDGRRFCVDET